MAERTQEKSDGFFSKLRKRFRKLIGKPISTAPARELDADTLLLFDGVTMRFGGLKAVDNLTFSVKCGEIYGLIGPNGAGKTTVFNCITQFYKPTAGEIWYKTAEGASVCLNDLRVHNIVTYGIARTFQNIEVVREISVLDNLLVAAHRQYKSNFFVQALHLPKLKREENQMRKKALGILEFLGIAAYAPLPAAALPYGILKKIEIARTLMANPRLIILDEPAAGLNDTETAALAVLIKQIKEKYNCTILLVEHDMTLVMDICDRICAIAFGKKLAEGTPKQIQSDKNVQSAYLGTEDGADAISADANGDGGVKS